MQIHWTEPHRAGVTHTISPPLYACVCVCVYTLIIIIICMSFMRWARAGQRGIDNASTGWAIAYILYRARSKGRLTPAAAAAAASFLLLLRSRALQEEGEVNWMFHTTYPVQFRACCRCKCFENNIEHTQNRNKRAEGTQNRNIYLSIHMYMYMYMYIYLT